jgi:hypothetical protein
MDEIDAKILEPVADKLKIKKSSLPKLLIFWGVFGIVLNIFWLINSLYPLSRFFSFDSAPSFWWQYVLYIFFIILSILELVYGLKLNRQEKAVNKIQKIRALLFLLVPLFFSIILSPLSLISTIHFFAQKTPPHQTACTLEAKVCPDGSSVGRTGPNCSFAPCPTAEPISTTDWKTYTSESMQFNVKIPSDWYSHKEEYNSTFHNYEMHFSYPIDNISTQTWSPNQELDMSIAEYPNKGVNAYDDAKERMKFKMMNLTLGKSIFIAGKKGVVLENINGHFIEVITTKGSQNYLFTLTTPTDGIKDVPSVPLEKYLPAFYKILSTFKYTK